MNLNDNENKVLEKLYLSQEEKIDEIIKTTINEIKNKTKKVEKEIVLEKYDERTKEEVRQIIDEIEENYSIKIAHLTRNVYEQGFKDGVQLILECFDK